MNPESNMVTWERGREYSKDLTDVHSPPNRARTLRIAQVAMLDFMSPCWTSCRHMLDSGSPCWTPGHHFGLQVTMLDSRSPHIGLFAAMLDSWSPCWNVDRHGKARASANRGKSEPRWLVGLSSRRNFKPAQRP